MRFPILGIAALGLALTLFTSTARADNFYHPLPAAKSAIDFDSRGFLIHGQRTWISSADIDYARVPRALWRDRLLKIKRAGFNCVEVYAYWNFHEIAPRQWDFTGDKDVGSFLDLVHEMGLYATVRVGPYCCAEWEDGGYPMWLRFIPGLRTRQNEPKYLAAVDDWYNHIIPIVAQHQISRGGSVIMVQLENEDDEGWGAWDLDPVKQAYFKNLLDRARANGIDVLTFFSGMNHGGDPAPKVPVDTTKQPNPWYCTEFWCNWYSRYGAMNAGELTHFDRATWRFLQNGAQGFNVYMFHGGSNFGTFNNNEDAGSYDYGAAIGQAGDLRPIYYKFKRVAYFARSFQGILEDANIAPTAPADNYPGLTVTTRSGPAGTIEFLDNPGATPVDAKFADGQTMTLAPGEITGLVRDFQLNENFKLVSCEARILGILRQDKVTRLFLYGPAGSHGHLSIDDLNLAGSLWHDKAWKLGAQCTLDFTFPSDKPEEHSMQIGGTSLSVVLLNSDMADKTFFIEDGKTPFAVTGAPYVGDFTPPGQAELQLPLDATESPALTIFGPSDESRKVDAKPLPPLNLTAPTLTNWAFASVDAEAAPNYDDSKWLTADAEKQRAAQTQPGKIEPRIVSDPPLMGADLDQSAYAWYRVKIHADAAGTKYLQIPFVGDQAYVYLNGKRTGGTVHMGPRTVPLDLQAGDNTLAILTSHNGRNKLGSYGSIAHLDTKGLTGSVRLLPANSPQIPLIDAKAQDWWGGDHPHPPVEQLVAPGLDTSDVHWGDINFRANYGGQIPAAWRDPFVCIRATLPDIAGLNRTLHVGMFDEKVAFYLNGQKIGSAHNDHWNAAVPDQYAPAPTTPPAPHDSPLINGSLDLPLDAAWKTGGPNVLAIIIENSHAQATVGMLTLTSGDPGTEVTGWKMRGGVTVAGTGWKAADAGWPETPASSGTDWKPAPSDTIAPGVPTFYRTTFTIPADYYKDATPILRLSSKGMSRGFAWLNGHNLGRYPEKIAVDGLYLPECWLRPGANELVILDEEGNAIAPEHLYIETAASRRIVRH